MIDSRLGSRTRGVVRNQGPLRELSLGKDPEYYEPVNLRWWRLLTSTITVDPKKATFVDLGAGRGRALILAARAGYRRIVGVELDPVLAAEARENLERWSRRHATSPRLHLAVIQEDAAAYALPPGPLVITLFNPFGAVTLRHVLKGLCNTPRAPEDPVYIAYFNPVQAAVFEEFGRLAVHAQGRDWTVYRLVRSDLPARTGTARP